METFERDGLIFDVRDSGALASGAAAQDPVVLLHGFPQTSYAWSGVTDRLTAAGRRCLAPDLRGYSPRARPVDRWAYRMEQLVGDVVALLDAAGLDRVHLVGHDWGGALAWATASAHPDRLSRLTVLSTPHPAALGWALRHSDQARRSWYMAAMQVPVLPEAILRFGMRGRGLGSLGLPEDYERAYAAHLSQLGAWEGAIAWYRGASITGAGTVQAVTVPTTYVWGSHDAYLGRAAAEATEKHVAATYRFVELDAGHFLPETRPDDVAEAILEPLGDPA